jgi:hypothetical protein
LSASNTAESTSRMMGDASAWMLSIERTSSPFSSVLMTWILKDSDACSSTRWVPWLRFSAVLDGGGRTAAGCTIVRRQRESSSTTTRSVGSAITSTSRSSTRW